MRTIVNILVCALLMLLSLFFPQGHCQNSQSPIAADTLQAEQLAEQARSFAKKSNYDSTIAKFKAAAAIYSRLANEYSEKVFWEKCLENLNQAGYYYWLNLQSAQALRLLDSVVVLVSAHLDTNHFQMAKANHSIGVVYIDSGKFGLSEKALQKALRIYQRTLGKKHKEAGLVYTSLGILYYQRTDYDLSIRNIKEALNIFNGQNEDVRFPIARAHLNLGRAYWRSGDLNEAIVQFTTSVDICEDLYPPNHPQIARTISNLVAVYSEKGDYDTALLYANRGLQIFKENDVNQRSIHAAIVQATNELGDVYRNKRQLETARDYYLESLRLSTQISFPPGRQSWIYMDLGKVEKELGNFKKALEYAETGLEKRLSQYSEDH
nr:tetratricopeptide repeat protein [Saprospiraceae bacterium]